MKIAKDFEEDKRAYIIDKFLELGLSRLNAEKLADLKEKYAKEERGNKE